MHPLQCGALQSDCFLGDRWRGLSPSVRPNQMFPCLDWLLRVSSPGRMKLIQHLERKLSWRKKQPRVQNACASGKSDAKSRSRNAKKFASAAIKVSDSEFSQYIRFSNPLRTAPMPHGVQPSYEVISIQTRSPFQASRTVSPLMCDYRSPSSRHEAELDMHMYDKLNCTPIRPYPPSYPLSSPSLSPTVSKYGNSPGPISVTSSCRRNRIKTNPWFNSPWAGKKSFPASVYTAQSGDSTNSENVYESIDNLNWHGRKENVSPSKLHLLSDGGNHLAEWNYSPLGHSTPKSRRVGTFVKGRLPHHLDAYPQSPYSNEHEVSPFMEQVPSPEFVNQSHQICSEISNYFDASHSPKERPRGCPPHGQSAKGAGNVGTGRPSFAEESLLSKFDSMETIDLTPNLDDFYGQAVSKWSLHEQPSVNQLPLYASSASGSGHTSAQQSPGSVKSRKSYDSHSSKRKRPDSIYSTKQSKKVDKLKCQLKEVVHAAILEAKKKDTKKV